MVVKHPQTWAAAMRQGDTGKQAEAAASRGQAWGPQSPERRREEPGSAPALVQATGSFPSACAPSSGADRVLGIFRKWLGASFLWGEGSN